MKRLLFFLVCFAYPNFSFSQNQELFKVLYLDGALFNQSQGKAISIGDSVSEFDSVTFQESTRCYLANGNQKFILKPKKYGRNTVGKSVRPILERKMITMRGNESANTYAGFKEYFGEDSFLIWDSIVQFNLDSLTFSTYQNEKYFISYLTKDNQTKNIPVVIKNGKASIEFSKLLNEINAVTPVKLNKIDLGTAVIETKFQFSIFFKREKSLMNEIEILFPEKVSPEVDRKDQIANYLYEMYGRFDSQNFELLYKQLGKN